MDTKPSGFDTFLAPLIMRALRVLVGKNLPSLGRAAQTALGSALVTWGMLNASEVADGLSLGEVVMSLGGLALILESRVNSYLRGRTLYGMNLSPLAALVGRSGASAARALLGVVSSALITMGVFPDLAPEAVASLPVDEVTLGLMGLLVGRLMSWVEAWLHGDLPEQVGKSRAEPPFISVDGI